MMRAVGPEVVAEIVKLFELDYSADRVAAEVKLSKPTVYRIYKKHLVAQGIIQKYRPRKHSNKKHPDNITHTETLRMKPISDELTRVIALLEDPDELEPYRVWLTGWQSAYKSAVGNQNSQVQMGLLAQFARNLIAKVKDPEPIVKIQPVEFCPILPPCTLETLTEEIVTAMLDLTIGIKLSNDQAQQCLNALCKFYPELEATD